MGTRIQEGEKQNQERAGTEESGDSDREIFLRPQPGHVGGEAEAGRRCQSMCS